eukprot:CAMPEP_0196782856 /NCGR_PEP_ID=MMETSP1104-20130614/12170_1 /TAXON_ID=33652 /ORGANISM="Cafeteria sp., Strain Caron Lab Isolate" /LENGTH=291 /DNA_ID=CAMNT_0042153101 /DNA_START=3 /DNA_END=874 /DNA_ORIENTATION=-
MTTARSLAALAVLALVAGAHGRSNVNSRTSRGGSDAASVQPLHRSFVLEHSLDGGASYAMRGQIDVHTSRISKDVTVKASNVAEATSGDAFKTLVRAGERYHVRLRSADAFDYVHASLPACELVGADFEDDLVVLLDGEATARLMGLEYRAYGSRQCLGEEHVQAGGIRFRSSASVATPQPAPSLPAKLNVAASAATPAAGTPGAGAGGSVGAEGVDAAEGKGEGEKKEQSQSFFAKYWYIIVPAVLMSLLPGGQQQGQAQGQGQGQGGRGGGAPQQGQTDTGSGSGGAGG